MSTRNPITFRLAEPSDENLLVTWLLQPGVLEWFPVLCIREVKDAARIWMSFIKHGSVITSLWDGLPCGTATLYLQPYKKLSHQCLFAIIVDEKYRGKGVGSYLIQQLIILAQEKFKLEFIHLEVYEHNPAIRLYKRMGFEQYGVHRRFTKENGIYKDKILMQKML